MSNPINASELKAASPLFDCHLVALFDSTQTLRNHQLCLTAWLRAYVTDSNNDAAWFKGQPYILFAYTTLDTLLAELIECSFEKDKQATAQRLYEHIQNAMAETLLKEQEFLRESFAAYLPERDDSTDDLDVYEHAYAYTTLYEFVCKCTYCLQDQDNTPKKPGCVAAVTEDQLQAPRHPKHKL